MTKRKRLTVSLFRMSKMQRQKPREIPGLSPARVQLRRMAVRSSAVRARSYVWTHLAGIPARIRFSEMATHLV
jgi:hypothetical protein